MSTRRWRKSSYCQDGEACVHVSPTPTVVHIADDDPPGPSSPSAWRPSGLCSVW
ncbi:DUF397 domain-containing protein [Streptomyces sp. 900105755]